MPNALPAGGGAAALEALCRAVEGQPHGSILLTGPASPARRRLLEALSARLGDNLESIWLEGGDLSPGLIWVRIAAALGVTPGYDARHRVLHLLGDRVLRRGGIVVFAPDAETMAGDSLSSLVNNARAERGLHLVLAATSAGALAARLPEDATLVDWDGEALGVLPPSAPMRAVEESTEERIEMHGTARGPAPSRPAARKGRSSAALKGTGAVLAAALAFVLAWSLSQSRSREPAESGLAATGAASPSSEPARPAPDPIPGATPSETATAPEAEAPPAPAAAEPAPPLPDPIARAAPRDVPAETALAPPPPPAAASPPEPAAALPPESAAAPPPESAAASAQEAAAAPPPAPVAPLAEPPPTPASAPATPPAPREAPAPPPLARGALSIDSEIPVRIEIDGKPYGRTPLGGLRLPRGRHRIVARYPDGASALKSVDVGDEDVAVFYR